MSIRRTSVTARPLSVSSPVRRSATAHGAEHLDVAGGRGRRRGPERDEAPVDEHRDAIVLHECGHHVVAGDPVLRPVEHDDLLGEPHAAGGDAAPRRLVGRESRFGQQFVDRDRRLLGRCDDLGVELLALVEAPQLPHAEPQHAGRSRRGRADEMRSISGAAGTGTSR